MNSHEYPAQSFAFHPQSSIFSIPVSNVDCRTVKNNTLIALKRFLIIILLMSMKLIQSLQCESRSSIFFYVNLVNNSCRTWIDMKNEENKEMNKTNIKGNKQVFFACKV